ncbi:MAG: pyridoxamine 5'-phosphate oxidase family protein [Candidatus Hodarchaeota archaeon]
MVRFNEFYRYSTKFTDESLEFLRTAKIGRLATYDESGYPNIVPIWFIQLENQNILMLTPPNSEKVKNIQRNSKACFIVDIYEDEMKDVKTVMIQGDMKIKPELFDLAYKLLLQKYPIFKEFNVNQKDYTVLEITPKKTLIYFLKKKSS